MITLFWCCCPVLGSLSVFREHESGTWHEFAMVPLRAGDIESHSARRALITSINSCRWGLGMWHCTADPADRIKCTPTICYRYSPIVVYRSANCAFAFLHPLLPFFRLMLLNFHIKDSRLSDPQRTLKVLWASIISIHTALEAKSALW